MKRGMTIEYVKCRADLNFEVDFITEKYRPSVAGPQLNSLARDA